LINKFALSLTIILLDILEKIAYNRAYRKLREQLAIKGIGDAVILITGFPEGFL